MLPRIKQTQAGDRFFLAQKWPAGAGFIQSLTGQGATGSVAFPWEGADPGRVLCAWLSHLSMPEKLQP